MRLPVFPVLPLLCALVAAAAAPARAQREDPPRVRFAEELGFKDFLEGEPEELPGTGPARTPRIQRPLFDVLEWRERTAPKFGVCVSGSEYYYGATIGKNLIGRFFLSGFGSELTAFFHADKGVDVYAGVSYGWHQGGSGDLGGQRTELTDYHSFEFVLGVHPFIGLGALTGGGASLDGFRLGARLGAGASRMTEVERKRPAPEEPFWNQATVATAQVSLHFELDILETTSLFLESGVRLYSPPAADSRSRPDNQSGPFFYLLWQAGFLVRF